MLETFGSLLISICYGDIKVSEFFIKIVIYFVLIIAALIYNEFIILNFCGFQKYTHLFLLKKANNDLELTILNNNDKLYTEDEDNENDLYSEDENNKKEIINNKENLNNESGKSNLTENKE